MINKSMDALAWLRKQLETDNNDPVVLGLIHAGFFRVSPDCRGRLPVLEEQESNNTAGRTDHSPRRTVSSTHRRSGSGIRRSRGLADNKACRFVVEAVGGATIQCSAT